MLPYCFGVKSGRPIPVQTIYSLQDLREDEKQHNVLISVAWALRLAFHILICAYLPGLNAKGIVRVAVHHIQQNCVS